MIQKNHNVSVWLETAVSGIRFKPDRQAVEKELREHIEDKTLDLMRIFPGMTEEEAREQALDRMGDPEEIGKELAKVHKPWLGYLWVASRTVLLLVLAVAVFHWGSRAVERVQDWWLFCTLRAGGLPWEPFSLEAAWRVRAVDSFGNQYYDSFQVYELREDRGDAGYVMVNSGDSGLFHEGFDLEIIDIAPGAEWIRLEFDRGGPAWSLTIPLMEDTP